MPKPMTAEEREAVSLAAELAREEASKKAGKAVSPDQPESLLSEDENTDEAKAKRKVAEAREKHARSVQTKRVYRDLAAGRTPTFDEAGIARALQTIRDVNQEHIDKGTTPRDVLEYQPDEWDCPPEVRRHIVVEFHSDFLMQRRPVSTFQYEIWQPVTEKEIKEFGLRFRTRLKARNGQPLYGLDMKAYWTTRELYDQQKAVNRSSTISRADLEGTKERLQSSMHRDSSLIGDVHHGHGENIPTVESLEAIGSSPEAEAARDVGRTY